MTKIRISGISDLATARATAALDINYIGLNLSHGSENAISPIKVSDYTQWLSGVKIIAQVHHLNQSKAERFIELLNLPFAEILGENATQQNNAIWCFTKSYNSSLMTKASTDNFDIISTENKDSVFFKVDNNALENLTDLKAKGIENFDIEINDFLEEGQLVFDKLQAVIAKLGS